MKETETVTALEYVALCNLTWISLISQTVCVNDARVQFASDYQKHWSKSIGGGARTFSV